MDPLALDLWRYLLAWCTPHELLELRELNKTARAIVAQLAFPRTINGDTARRWFCDPAFQARVATTMAHPERDLHVWVSGHDLELDHWYSVGAVADLTIQPNPYWRGFVQDMPMPRIVVCGPIEQLTLWSYTFARDRMRNTDLCANIDLVSWFARDHNEFPRQLSGWYLVSSSKEQAYAVAAKHAFREDLIHWPTDHLPTLRNPFNVRATSHEVTDMERIVCEFLQIND